MLEIKFRGSGGHGAVVAAKILAEVATKAGRHAQAFAAYGARRRGGKVESYARISDGPIPLRCKMYQPDLVVVMGESLLADPETLAGLKAGGRVLVNTAAPLSEVDRSAPYSIHVVDATGIAGRAGVFLPGGFPVINTTMLGALVGLLGLPLEALFEAIRAKVPKAEKNMACAQQGYEQVAGRASGDNPQDGGASAGKAARSSMVRTPVFDHAAMKRCHSCLNCYIFCPSLAISIEEDPFGLRLDPALCARCGICLTECPRGALNWGEA